MEPITKLLKSKANNQDWNPALRGALRSAIAGRQHTQARVFAAEWAEHNKCLFLIAEAGRPRIEHLQACEAPEQDQTAAAP